MCRRNQVWGWLLAAFGLGLLIGTQIESGFLCVCLSFGAIIIGFAVSRKN